MYKKLKHFLYVFIQYGGITITIAIVLIIIVYFIHSRISTEPFELIDWTMFSSVIGALFLDGISRIIRLWAMNKLEDPVKLTTDYPGLVKHYRASIPQMVHYDNSHASAVNKTRFSKFAHGADENDISVIPVILEYPLRGCKLRLKDHPTRYYQLPGVIIDHFSEIFMAHETSHVYNRLNIRVDSWKLSPPDQDTPPVLTIDTSRTTYFNSLVTNRAMDYRFASGITVRDLYEFGPAIHPLDTSNLSNHLGFNGFIESSDGEIAFIKRASSLSIGKRTYGDSIGASLKCAYALDSFGNLTEDGLIKGILREITDEIKIPTEKMEPFTFSDNIIAAYRDLVEGGKPQLLFYAHSLWTRKEIMKNFTYMTERETREERSKLLHDGTHFLWIPRAKLCDLCIFSGGIIYEGNLYSMMPSASACVAMLIDYLSQTDT